ncbi:MAG: JmjC domain-containing protein [Acidiferrobacterales bacterium]
MSGIDKPALRELVAPRSVDEFFASFWPDRSNYFVIEGDAARLPECLRREELSSIEALIQANQGRVLFTSGPNSSYMLPTDTQYAASLFTMGLTLSFEDVTPYIAGAIDFMRQLEQDLGINEGSARMTGWASPRENGSACHYDADDIIAIQLLGTKRFELAPVRELRAPYGKQYSPGTMPFEDMYPQMTQGFPSWRGTEFDAIDMKPGTVLCFRRGMWHRTYASTNSLAVSIAIRPATAMDCLIDQLRAVLLQDPRWRRPLYGAWGNKQEREAAFDRAKELIDEIPKITSTISPKDLILPSLSESKLLAMLDQDSRFQRIPGTAISLVESNESKTEELQWIRITLKDEKDTTHTLSSIEIPTKYVALLNWLASRKGPFCTRDLEMEFPAIPLDEHIALLEHCVRGGLLKLLWFPSLDGVTR